MNLDESKLDELSQKAGILLSFIDRMTNITYKADTFSKQTILKSLGYNADTNNDIELSLKKIQKEKFSNLISKTIVVRESESSDVCINLYLLDNELEDTLVWQINANSGEFFLDEVPLNLLETISREEIDGVIYVIKRLSLSLELPLGYHELTVFLKNAERKESALLIYAPDKCYMNEALAGDKKVFGFPLQLYSLKSKTNWGIGDFSDLKNFVKLAKKSGASFVGVNPLTALFQDNPDDASPYFPNSRMFLNPLYVDMEKVPDAIDNVAFHELKQCPVFKELLKKSRHSKVVDYKSVSSIKKQAFKILFKTFRDKNFDTDGMALTKRGKAFEKFLKDKGESLIHFATFQVLRNIASKNKTSMMWREWEKDYQIPNSDKLKQFYQDNEMLILQICYQQFVAFEQLDDVLKEVRKLSIGLYTDMPVGVSDNSAEVWADQSSFIKGVTTGAPPDAFNIKGQDWSLSPFNPKVLHDTGYKAFINVIQSAMKGAGAVRIDHAFGLMRLYLRVQGGTGAYLKFPFKELTAILALESHLNKCVVIAEDLGTAPDGFSDEMIKLNAFSFKIMHFERNWDGFLRPEQYSNCSLISTGTHDLPSYTGYFKELDLELSKKMNIISMEQYQSHKEERKIQKRLFIDTFIKEGFLMPEKPYALLEKNKVPDFFIPYVYRYLAKVNSKILLVRPEDIFEMDDQFNLPGTYMEYPNWRFKLPLSIELMDKDKRFKQIKNILITER